MADFPIAWISADGVVRDAPGGRDLDLRLPERLCVANAAVAGDRLICPIAAHNGCPKQIVANSLTTGTELWASAANLRKLIGVSDDEVWVEHSAPFEL